MFVKIIEWEVSENTDSTGVPHRKKVTESLFHCKRLTFVPEAEDKVINCVVIDLIDGSDMSYDITIQDEHKKIEVISMNDNGRTISINRFSIK